MVQSATTNSEPIPVHGVKRMFYKCNKIENLKLQQMSTTRVVLDSKWGEECIYLFDLALPSFYVYEPFFSIFVFQAAREPVRHP